MLSLELCHTFFLFFFLLLLLHLLLFKYFNVPCGKFGPLYFGKAQQPQEQRYPFLSACVVFSCVQTMVWLTV